MSEKDIKKPGKHESAEIVSFIEDPYGINTLEISEAQQDNAELELDEELGEELNEDHDDDFESEDDDGPGRLDSQASDSAAETLDLHAAADEWAPDANAADSQDANAADSQDANAANSQHAALAPAESAPSEPASTDALAQADAQLASEPLDLEQDTTSLDNLARALAEEETRRAAEAAELAGATVPGTAEYEEEQAKELARQIAEDQAIQQQLAQEAAEAQAALEADPELLAALPKAPQADEQGNLDLSELQSCIETLLFMTDKPASVAKLKDWLGSQLPKENQDALFEQALQGLQARYSAPHHGFELVQVSNAWQFRTKPGRAALAKKLAKIQTQRLSSGGMETLAIVAYRQPVMKEEIDKIRGVDSSYFVRGLLDKKLIAISGRSELPGRPMLYSTTDTFLELFGLKDLSSMPSLRELEQMIPSSQSQNPEDKEDPRVKEMRRLVGQMKADTSTTLNYDPREDEKILKEIRERIGGIATSTPYLDEQKAQEKAAKEAAKEAAKAENQPVGTQLALEPEAPAEAPLPAEPQASASFEASTEPV